MSVVLVIRHAKRMRRIITVICGLSGSNIICPRYLLNGAIFGKRVTEHKMCVLIFSTTFVWNVSHSEKNSARYCHECAYVFFQSTGYSCQILVKHEFSRRILKKKQTIKFRRNPSIGSRVVLHGNGHTDRRTNGHDEAKSRLSQFCRRAKSIQLRSYVRRVKRYHEGNPRNSDHSTRSPPSPHRQQHFTHIRLILGPGWCRSAPGRAWGSNSEKVGNFSLLQNVQTGSGTHPTVYLSVQMFLLVGKAAAACNWPLPSSAEAHNEWSYTSTPLYSFTAWTRTLPFTFNFNIILQHTPRFRKWSPPYNEHVTASHTTRPLQALPTPNTLRN